MRSTPSLMLKPRATIFRPTFFQLRQLEQAAGSDRGRQDQLAERQVLGGRSCRAAAVASQPQGREGWVGGNSRCQSRQTLFSSSLTVTQSTIVCPLPGNT